jgi:hypothetical protein
MPLGRWRRHPARAARVLTAGLSTAAALSIVAALAQDSERDDVRSPDQDVEVRIGDGVSDQQARRALQAWLEGQPALDRDDSLRVVDEPADTASMPS